MKNLIFVAILLLTIPALAQTEQQTMPEAAQTPTLFDNPEMVKEYQATITQEDLAAHLYFYASDFFEGRETSTKGQHLAALYLASQYRKIGLAPAGTTNPTDPRDPTAYFQPFELDEEKLVGSDISFSVNGKEVANSHFSADGSDGNSFIYRPGATDESMGEVIFAGYGIKDTTKYNDYAAMTAAGLDISGKWLMMLDGEPMTADGKSQLTEDGAPSAWTARWWSKMVAAGRGVPAGILIVDPTDGFGEAVAGRADRIKQNDAGLGTLSLPREEGEHADPSGWPPIMYISADIADQILASSNKTIAGLKSGIEANLTPQVFALENATATSTVEKSIEKAGTENVVAFIEGSDPLLKHEVLIISAHLDHIGVDLSLEGDQINNGADDDGTGTVALLEIAEAFQAAVEDGHGPRRSIAFLHVTGEEKGLLGSEYYADREPIFPIENTVADLNIDMIGRFDPTHPDSSENYVYLIGSNLISQELHDINWKANDITSTDVDLDERFNTKDDPNQYYRRSDHWNFGKHSIPFIFFFTGTHEDYHGVGDEADKIEYERMSRIVRLVFATAWQVANQDERPVVSGEGFN